MPSNVVNVMCQVGFGSKKSGEDPYFHTINGKPFVGNLQIYDHVSYLSPFTLEDLANGDVEYDLLPQELQLAIAEVVVRTRNAIENTNPEKLEVIDFRQTLIAMSLPSDQLQEETRCDPSKLN